MSNRTIPYPGVPRRDSKGHCTQCGCLPRRKPSWVRKVGWRRSKDGMQWRLIQRPKSYRVQHLQPIPGMGRYAWFDVQTIGCTYAKLQTKSGIRPIVVHEEEAAWNALLRRIWEHEQNLPVASASANSSPFETDTGDMSMFARTPWERMRGWLRAIGIGSGTKPSPTASDL